MPMMEQQDEPDGNKEPNRKQQKNSRANESWQAHLNGRVTPDEGKANARPFFD